MDTLIAIAFGIFWLVAIFGGVLAVSAIMRPHPHV
jgi:hypothetical protein